MADGDTDGNAAASRFAELAPPAALIGLSLYLWTLADTFTGGARRYEAIGPDFFPKALLALMVILCVSQILAVFLRRRPSAASGEAGPVYWADLALAGAVTAVYAAALYPVGFLIATSLFQAALLGIVFRVRRLAALTLVPLGLTGGLALLFVGVMNAPLPRGRWMFGDFSRLFY